jgi:16S rRNA (guanine527-N7)-methyltransferase
LVESNQRKCAFLRQAIRLTAAAAVVHQGRAEAILALWDQPADVVTARAVAPLERLLGLTEPLLRRGIAAIFPKGRGFRREVDDAALVFDFDLVQHQSRIDPDAAILEIRNLRPKGGTSGKG